MKDMPGQLCRKLRQSQPEKSGQVGQAFLQQLPLKLSGSERDNYSQLGNNFKTATSRQLVGKWAMTVLKMRPKLGLISRMSLVRSRDRNSRQIVGIITRKDAGKSWAKLAQLFYNNFRPSWAEVSVEIRPMMGLISSVATSSQVGTKLKSLANLARLLTEAGLLTCGQLGHKLKNGAQVDQHFRCLKDNSVQFELN